MGLIQKTFVLDDVLLGFWEITEDYDALYQKVIVSKEDNQVLEGFKNDKRKLEWLSVRALTNELTGKNTTIIYNSKRKPLLKDKSYNISISHSGDLTSVLISKESNVGIDIEKMSHKIINVAFKFINTKEYITSNLDLQRLHLYIHWCAKEAIYKICDKQDINFKDNIFIEPFEPQDMGVIKGVLDNINGREEFDLIYNRKGNYVIVWTVKK
jgi:4'-phosphopantetheinyl transferase EntD